MASTVEKSTCSYLPYTPSPLPSQCVSPPTFGMVSPPLLKDAKRLKLRELTILKQKAKRALKYQSSSSRSRSLTPVTHGSEVSPSPDRMLSPLSPVSPLFVPKHTDEGCSSSSEPVSSVPVPSAEGRHF